jgi:hypothetical protein
MTQNTPENPADDAPVEPVAVPGDLPGDDSDQPDAEQDAAERLGAHEDS